MAAGVTTRVIVKYKNATGRAAALANGALKVDLASEDAVAIEVPNAALAGLQNNPNIDFVEEDAIRYPLSMPQQTPYGIPSVQADLLSDGAAGNTTVCIIDSGLNTAHEDHAGNRVTSSSDPGSGNPYDDQCGHGTHVAGTIAALDNTVGVVGVLPHGNVNLHIVKVFGGADCGWTYSSSLVAALNACKAAFPAANKKVVSMSLGGTTKSAIEDSAFASAYSAGILSIAAAGNDGNNRVSYPAGYASVVSVAAVDSTNTKASFSQYNSDVELSAPGVGVLSTVPWIAEGSVTPASATTPTSGGMIEGTTAGTATGALVDGGLCGTSSPDWAGKIVVCQRGTYTFVDKVTNVVTGGGVGIVIYNNVTSDSSCGNFGASATAGTAIPGVTLSCDDGAALAALAGQTATMTTTYQANASGYESWNGTSMATPHVSGVAALVWSNNPSCTNTQVRFALQATAVDLGTSGRDVNYGFGLVQAKAASDLLTAKSCNVCQAATKACTKASDCCSWSCDTRKKQCK